MRILHTSDWHLGQYFLGKTRQTEHARFLQWLTALTAEKSIDCVIIAGDLFDTGAPPSYARELYNQTVIELHRQGVQLIVIGGNHDSVATLSESRSLVAYLSATVIPAIQPGQLTDQLVPLYQRDGSVGAVLCAIPFIRPRDVLNSQSGQSAEEKQQSLQEAITAHYQALFLAAQTLRATHQWQVPILATGHLTALGASLTESVRDIYVGSLESLAAENFPPVDYLALGHIHRPQTVGGKPHFRYSGSPIPLSFDEVAQQKEVVLIETSGISVSQIMPVPVPSFQPLLRLTGSLAELQQRIPEQIGLVSRLPEQTVWLDILVREDDYLTDLQNRLQPLVEQYPVDILRIRRERSLNSVLSSSDTRCTLAELTPLDVFVQRLADETLTDGQRDTLMQYYQQILAGLHDETSQTPDFQFSDHSME